VRPCQESGLLVPDRGAGSLSSPPCGAQWTPKRSDRAVIGRVQRLPRPLRAVADRLRHAAVLSDFDGTLAPIVDDPAASRPVPGAAEALRVLARRAGLVAVVSGRPRSFLTDLGFTYPGVATIGQYGHEGGPPLRAVEEAARRLRDSGFLVEVKSHSITLHYRNRPERQTEAQKLAQRVAGETGLVTFPAKMAVELRPSRRGKGEVVRRLARGWAVAVYAGDDVGDVEAFRMLRRLHVLSASVAVLGRETPSELAREADVVCEGPQQWVAWLRELSRAR
jgi:trehalose 6-phosphate phosphatase